MVVRDFTLTRFQFPRDRVIGDSQVRVEHCHVGVLELHDSDGRDRHRLLLQPVPSAAGLARARAGVPRGGLAGARRRAPGRPAQPHRPAARRQHPRLLDPLRAGDQPGAVGPARQGAGPAALASARRPRSQGPALRQRPRFPPLRRGLRRAVRAGAARRATAASRSRSAIPTSTGTCTGCALVREAVGDAGPIMVDANEAWSPKEAIRRLRLFLREGFDILWIEDPVLRDDFEGLREIRLAVPEILVNTGEYLGLRGQAQADRGARRRHPQRPRPDQRRDAGRLARRRARPRGLARQHQLRDRRASGGGAARVPLDGILVPEL